MSDDWMSDQQQPDREGTPPAQPLRAAPSDEFPDLGFGSPPQPLQPASAEAEQMDLSRSQESISEAVLGQQQQQLQQQQPQPVDLGEGQNRWMDQAVAGAIAAVPHMASRVAAAAGFAAAPAPSAAPAVAPHQPPPPPAAVVILPLELPAMRELPPVKLGRTPKERTLYEQLGDLYSLIVTTEHIETAYVRDAISEQAYTAVCSKLIAQYRTLRESMGEHAPELDAFCREYGLECRAAENRFRIGIPATVVHGDSSAHGGGAHGGGPGSAGGGGNKLEVAVFHAVQHFITTMDSLKLNLRAVDELHPTLSELMDSVNKVPNLPQGHESKTKVLQWLTTLHGMKAHEELTDEQARQMSFDLDSAYNSFHRFVKGGQ